MEVKKQLKIEYIPIGDIKPNEYNPKILTEKEEKDLEKSIIKFGIVDPLIINIAKGREGIIIGGHQRYRVYRKLNFEEVPVVKLNIPDLVKERELCLRLSKNVGEFDLNLLSEFDEKLLENIGWSSKELNRIFVEVGEDNFDAESEYERIKEPETKSGDLYQLGAHLLLCGDATKKEDIKKLIECSGYKKNQADMVLTDPPYGINIIGGKRRGKFGKVGGGSKWASSNYYPPIIGDEKEFDPRFLLELSKKVLIFGGNYFANKLPNSRCWLIWDKTGEFYTQNDFADCEIIWTNLDKVSRIYRCKWRGLRKEKGEDVRKRIHPTQKPIKLLNDILRDYSKQGDIILDLFGGSGSTLIACEQTGRICDMVEIDPIYVDIIISRWEKFTGEKAKKFT